MEKNQIGKLSMNKKKINKLAEEISFRLLATKKHEDFDWLVKKLYSLVDSDYTKVVTNFTFFDEEYYFKKYTEEEWKYELDLNVEMAKELLAYQRTPPSKRVWEDLVFDLLQLQKKTNIPTNFTFFKEWIESQKVNGLPNSSSGSFFTGLTDIDGLLSAMNFEEYNKETGEDLYTDKEYDKAQKYHTDKIIIIGAATSLLGIVSTVVGMNDALEFSKNMSK